MKTLGGVDIPKSDIHHYLEQLGFKITGTDVQVPSWRPDIEGPADLVEEVLRLYGYDKIPSVTFSAPIDKPALTATQERRFMARDVLAGRGMIEAVTWSFMGEPMAKRFGMTDENLKLLNPISQDINCMRPSVLPNLLEAATKNHNRGVSHVELFEIGPRYRNTTPTGQDLIAAGLRSGPANDKNQ